MSYAEYGQRIFFTGINTQLQVEQKDGFGQRLKMIESCADIRAWSSDPIQNIRYFREATEQQNKNDTAISIPNKSLKEIENNDTEKDSKEQELNEDKASSFTRNHRKKLKQDPYHGVMMDYVINPLNKLMDAKKFIFGEPKTRLTGIKKKNNRSKFNNRKNFSISKSITNIKNKKLINKKIKSNTDISISLSVSSFPQENIDNEFLSEEVRSETNSVILKTEDYDNDENNDDSNINDSQLDGFSESEHSSVNESESIIQLKPKIENIIKVKNHELGKLKEENNQLKLCLKDYDSRIRSLSENHQNMIDLQNLLAQSHKELNEFKNEAINGRKIIDQLKRNLEEKKEECDTQNQQLNKLKRDAADNMSIKNERDSLANTFEEIAKLLEHAGYYNKNLEQSIRNLLDNHRELMELKKNSKLSLLESEAELTKMYNIINRLHDRNENQTITISKLKKDIEQKTNLLHQHEEKITLLTKQCQEKSEIEESFYENESINKDCDQTFAKYFKQSLEKLNDLTNALKDAGDDVEKRKRDINKLKKQMNENIQAFKDQLKKKNKESNLYRSRYEECQITINQQMNEIKNLKRDIDNLERKIIYKMKLSVSELHQEHNSLTTKIQDLTNCIHERNMKIEGLESEKANLLIRIDHTSAQLEEQNQQVEVLKKMNSIFREKLEDRKKNIESIFSALQSIQSQIEKVHPASLKDKKDTVDENHSIKVDNSIVDSENFSYENSHNVVEDKFTNILNPTESFEYKISSIKNDINMLSSDLHVNESDEEIRDNHMKTSNNRLDKFSQKTENLSFSIAKQDITHPSILKKQSHYYNKIIKPSSESYIFSRSSDTQSSDDKSDFLKGILSSKMKTMKQYISGNQHINSKSYNNMEKKSSRRSTTQEFEESESSSCNQFILHCSEYLSDEKNMDEKLIS